MQHRISSIVLCLLIVVTGCLSCSQMTYRLNEVGAQSSLKLIRKAQTTYRSQDPQGRFGTLRDLHSKGLIDQELAGGIKSGYRFDIQVRNDSFAATATPLEYNVSGSWSFYLDESGVIRGTVRQGKAATVNDNPVRYQ